ncbi:MAG TPA: hypothetical protein VG676_14300 [Chitinophagaceae bacterium]|jgi:hypothetical protein|nr:hypothetical protein [Chitinophagaceae bacterium]
MKKAISLLVVALSLICISSQAQQKASWKEMDEFHQVMSATFHPSEEGKLDPIKTRSGEMVNKAVSWQKSDAPKGYNKNAVKASLKKLVSASKELHQLVKNNATDEVLKEKLSSLHDIFHEITEKCEKEEEM